MKQFQDLLYEKSGQGVSFPRLLDAMINEVTIVTAVHNIKSNKSSKTAGIDKIKMDSFVLLDRGDLPGRSGEKAAYPKNFLESTNARLLLASTAIRYSAHFINKPQASLRRKRSLPAPWPAGSFFLVYPDHM